MKRYIIYSMGTLENSVSNAMTLEEAKAEIQRHIQEFQNYDDIRYYDVEADNVHFSAGAEKFFQSYDVQEVYDDGDGVVKDYQDIINLCLRARRCAEYYEYVLEDMYSVKDLLETISEIAGALMDGVVEDS